MGKDDSEDEELEEGEVSDEDEETRKERLKPPPVCRFYNKGACTWGASCRFIHPGVMDTGRSGHCIFFCLPSVKGMPGGQINDSPSERILFSFVPLCSLYSCQRLSYLGLGPRLC